MAVFMASGGAACALILANETAPTLPEPWQTLLNYGVIGVVLGLLIFGRLALGRELTAANLRIQDAVDRADTAEKKRDELNDKVSDKIIPLLTEATRVLTEVGRALQLSPTSSHTAEQQQLVEMLASIQSSLKAIKP